MIPVPNDEFEKIATEVLGIDTLRTRNSDSLDFHDTAVWAIREAMVRAFRLGVKAAEDKAGVK